MVIHLLLLLSHVVIVVNLCCVGGLMEDRCISNKQQPALQYTLQNNKLYHIPGCQISNVPSFFSGCFCLRVLINSTIATTIISSASIQPITTAATRPAVELPWVGCVDEWGEPVLQPSLPSENMDVYCTYRQRLHNLGFYTIICNTFKFNVCLFACIWFVCLFLFYIIN